MCQSAASTTCDLLMVLNGQGGREIHEVLEQLRGAFTTCCPYLPRNFRIKEAQFVTAIFPSWSCHLGFK